VAGCGKSDARISRPGGILVRLVPSYGLNVQRR
jgi:hypothetical protein